jgi:hypothetical protein
MVIFGGVRQHQRRSEPTEHLGQLLTRGDRIRERAVGNAEAEELGPQQVRGGGHLASANRSEVGDGYSRLAFVALAEDADGDGGSLGPRTRQGSCAEQFGVVWMSHGGEESFLSEAKLHG